MLPGLATLIALIVLLGLGSWQLARLAEKDQLVTQIEASLSAPPVPLPEPETWASLKSTDYDYRRVSLTGTFNHDKEALVFGFISVGGRGDTREGFFAVTPLTLADGSTVLVNRGFVPQALREQSARLEGLTKGIVTLTGLMRAPEKKGTFTPNDEPTKNLYFTIDPVTLASALKLDKAASFIVDADRMAGSAPWPDGGHTIVTLVNNHLQYALTWFALAFGLMGVFFVFARKRLNGSDV
jgi:surfeit locus 1 family protein